MTSKKLFYFLIVLLLLSFGLILGSAYYGSKILLAKSNQLSEVKLENRILQEQQNSLVIAKKDLAQYAELAQVVKSIVPADKDQAKTIREIVRIAQANQININSLAFPSSQLGSSKSATKNQQSKNPSTSAVTQAKPVPGIEGVYQLELSVQTEGYTSYNNFIEFLKDLESNRRTAHVIDIKIQPLDTNPSLLKFEFKANVFIKP
jgi:hypothetical protein